MEEIENKRGYIKTIFLVTVAIIVVVIIASIMYVWKTTGKNPIETIGTVVEEIISVITGDENGNTEVNQEDNNIEGSSGSSSTGTGGGSSSSGGGGSGEGGGSDCSREQITYSMININKISTCNLYQGEVCVDKTINCSLEIHNRDQEADGHFRVELIFIESQGDQETSGFDQQISEFVLPPRDHKLFEGSTNIISTGEEGLANKKINCFFHTLENPYKEVC